MRSQTLLQEAVDGYRRIGMPRHAAMAEAAERRI
jgi:hypothetical protein